MKGSYKIGAKGAIANPLEALVGVAEPRELGLSWVRDEVKPTCYP